MKRADCTLKKTPSLGGILAVALLLGLMFFKSLIFYGQLNLQHYDIPFTFATVGILLSVYLTVYFFAPKAAFPVLFSLYGIGCFFMAADSIYYAYVAKMPSMAQIGMVGQLEDVADTIETLIGLKQMIPLLDFPIWFLYAVNRKNPHPFPAAVPPKKFFAGGIALCLLCLCLVAGWKDFRPRYMVNELYCYHTYDIARTVLGSVSDRQVDKSLYTVSADRDSEYFGIAENRNLIVIQAEALQNFVIGAEYNGQVLTPNLNAMIGGDSLYFSNYYYQIGGGNTSDAEFAVNNSLFGPENEAGYVKYADNDYNGLPWLLKQNGYTGAYAFHGYYGSFWNRETAYPGQGFDDFRSLEDFEQKDLFPMGISDRELFRQSMEFLVSYEEPFYSFFITLSSHHPYAIPLKDRGISLLPEDEGTLFGLYIQSVNYVDTVLGEFIGMLKEAGLYDNSVLVIYGDHYALTNTDHRISAQVSAMTGRSYTLFDVFNVPLIIHVPGMGHTETFTAAGGHIDVMPTVLCLLGLENNKTVMFGQNLIEADTGFVCEQTHVAVGSFISDDLFFKKPYNNIEANFDVYRKGTMEKCNPADFEDLSAAAYKRVKDCEALLAANDIFLDNPTK